MITEGVEEQAITDTPTSLTTSAQGDNPKTIGKRVWDRMFNGENFNLPVSPFMERVKESPSSSSIDANLYQYTGVT